MTSKTQPKKTWITIVSLYLLFDYFSAITTEVCEKETLQLDCNWGEKINLIKAAYGIESSRNNCGIEFRKDCVAMNTISALSLRCNKQQYCTVTASNDVFGDPCKGHKKYLSVEWECIKPIDDNCMLKTDPFGIRYRGKKAVTKSGKKCQSWNKQQPNKNQNFTPDKFPQAELDENYCRNPGGKQSSPWCYNGEGTSPPWEHCELGVCNDIHTKEACENQGITIECGWGEHVKIKHAAYGVYSNGNSCGYKHKEKCVAENSVEAVEEICGKNRYRICTLTANNDLFGDPCRGSKKYLVVTWACAKDERLQCIEEHDPRGIQYRGGVTSTKNGENCQSWDSQHPNKHSFTPKNFPNAGLDYNYCRNPLGNDISVPWCYTADRQGWDWCDVRNCSKSDSITTTEEACEGEYLKIKCKRPYHVEIKEAAYGVWSNSNKCGAKYDEYGDCIAPNSMEIVREACTWQGRPTFECEVHAANNDKWTRPLFRDPCPGHKKYLRVSWDCVRDPECYEGFDVTGKLYKGTESVSRSGFKCQRWDKQHPNKHNITAENYPEANLLMNYCRNPNNDIFPWCYNGEGTEPERDYCDIIECTDALFDYDTVRFTDEEPQSSFYPYHVSVLVKIVEKSHLSFPDCTIYQEEHRCPNGDYFRFEFRYSHEQSRLVFHWAIRYAPLVTESMSIHEDWTDSGTDFINDVADLKDAYKPHKVKTLSVEINYHSMLVLVDYKPIKEYILNGDFFPFETGRIKSRGHLNLERCRSVSVKGNCYNTPCKFYTAHKFHDYRNSGEMERCMKIDRDECNTGYCHSGICESTDFEHGVCNCKYTNTFWVTEKNVMGEYCSIKKKEEAEQIVRWSQSYEIEVNFHGETIEVDLVPNFKDFSWKYYFIRIYMIKFEFGQISQKLVYASKSPLKGLPVGTGFTFKYTESLPNTTYLISTFGRGDLDTEGDERERSFIHYVEVHTPGYAFLPAPTDLMLVTRPGYLFELSWKYENEIPASEFLITISQPNGKVEHEVSTENHQMLTLQSNKPYTIFVESLNSIGTSKYSSHKLKFTTPFFEYNRKVVGKYDFAKWFFKENSITLDGWFVYFKNPVRRDTRVQRIALLCNYSIESIESDPKSDLTKLFSAAYHSARFNQSYQNHQIFSPYVTASFTTSPLPRRLKIGDKHFYEGYLNGALDKKFFYQIYVIVWFTSGQTVDVSIQFLGEVELSKIPWVIIFVSVAVAALVLTILVAIFNCFCYEFLLAHRQKQVELLRGKVSVRSLLVEEVYMNDILPDPDYDMTKSAEDSHDGCSEDEQSCYDAVKKDAVASDNKLFRRQSVTKTKRRHTFTSLKN